MSFLNVVRNVRVHPSYSLNRLVRDLLPLTTMDARGETKGISIRSYPYARCSVLNEQWRYQRCDTSFKFMEAYPLPFLGLDSRHGKFEIDNLPNRHRSDELRNA
jgi:hypothetical protein